MWLAAVSGFDNEPKALEQVAAGIEALLEYLKSCQATGSTARRLAGPVVRSARRLEDWMAEVSAFCAASLEPLPSVRLLHCQLTIILQGPSAALSAFPCLQT